MLIRYLDFLRIDPAAWIWLMVSAIAGIVTAVTVHEFAHAWSALRLGDTTARNEGRVTLNPLKHLDPLGSLLFLLAGFGWGRPTPVVPSRFNGDQRTGMGLVSVAGPVSNMVTALVLSLPVRVGLLDWQSPLQIVGVPRTGAEAVGDIVSYAILFNIFLAVFNLIPLVPLDGFKALVAVLPRRLALTFQQLERYGPVPLFLLLLLDIITPVSILAGPISAVANAIGRAVIGQGLI